MRKLLQLVGESSKKNRTSFQLLISFYSSLFLLLPLLQRTKGRREQHRRGPAQVTTGPVQSQAAGVANASGQTWCPTSGQTCSQTSKHLQAAPLTADFLHSCCSIACMCFASTPNAVDVMVKSTKLIKKRNPERHQGSSTFTISSLGE